MTKYLNRKWYKAADFPASRIKNACLAFLTPYYHTQHNRFSISAPVYMQNMHCGDFLFARLLHDNLGIVLTALVKLLFNSDHDLVLTSISDHPVRVVMENGKIIAVGHFLDDRFIRIVDLVSLKRFSDIPTH